MATNKRRKPTPEEEQLAINALRKMLSGCAPVDMLPLVRVRSVNQRVKMPDTGRTVSILRFSAEGLLTFGAEAGKKGQIGYVAGTKAWGWLWRIVDYSLWYYLRSISIVAKRNLRYDALAPTRDSSREGVRDHS